MNEVLAITYGLVPGFASGTVVANVVATIAGTAAGNTSPQSESVVPGTASVEFTGLAADTYNFSVNGVDASGNVLGTPVTGSFTLSGSGPQTISLSLPVSVSASQSSS